MVERYVEVYTANNVQHAYMIKASLQQEGIEVRITNEFLQCVVGELPPGISTAPGILVPEPHANQAAHLIDTLLKNKNMTSPNRTQEEIDESLNPPH